MDDAKLMELARQAGFIQLHGTTFPGCAMKPESLAKFAALVAADTQERCAKVCDERYAEYLEPEAKELAAAIRAMKD